MLRNIGFAALLAVMLMVLFVGTAQAQQNANVTASATVMTALTITENTNVAFGDVGATTVGAVYLDPASPLTASTNVGSAAATGSLTIAGANSQSIRLTWPATVAMTGPASLTYTLKVNGLTTNSQSGSGTLTLTSGYCNVTTSASGAYYLWVGGDLGTLSGQSTGSYTGTAPFTVEYN